MMRHSKRNRIRGLTVLEVLFSMVVILVGLVGVATILPLAGRQADDSQKIMRGLASGESALAVFQSNAVVQPRLEAPWQLVDDTSGSTADCSSTWYRSLRSLYNDLQTREIAKSPNSYDPNSVGLVTAQQNVALLQNQITSMGFCIDPLFWGFQPRGGHIGVGDAGVFRRTRFPYFIETTNPLTLSLAPGVGAPRLIRVSIADPLGPDVNGRNGWLRQPAAMRLATIGGGDLVQVAPETSKGSAPLRAVRWDKDLRVLSYPESPSMISWMATVTPNLSSQIINPLSISFQSDTSGNLVPPPISLFPEVFDLSVVVLSKRDVREDITGASPIMPSSERIFSVTDMSPDCMTAGTFNLTLNGSAAVSGRIRTGDWLMLSRNIFENPITPGAVIRQRHQWYRVVGTTGADTMPKVVRVIGAPWDWSQLEVNAFLANGVPVPPTPMALPSTVATVLKDVVQVYERRIELKMD